VNPLLRGSAAHVFVTTLTDPQLDDDDEHHLRRVLRVRDTDRITISDGAGSWLIARLGIGGVSVESPPEFQPAPRPATVISAIPKGDRPEWIVQKLTEIGVTTVGFMDCERSVVRWDAARAARQIDRLRRVAREAAMQSRRVWLPIVTDVAAFAMAASRQNCAVADPDGSALAAEVDTVLIGPEGGFTDGELAAVERRVSLSANVLRVETAALTAAIFLTLRNEVV
jgi:16S rRNA (uracil1498-N3)-methyltransferase